MQLPPAVKNKILPFAKRLRAIEPDLDIAQYQSLSADVDDIIDFSRRQGLPMKKAVELKKAIELDLDDINVPAVQQAFRKADKNWFELHRLFERPTAQRFARADRRIFDVGFEDLTTTEPNTKAFFKSVFNAGSPRAMVDLRKVVGDREFNRAVRAHIDDVFVQAIERAGVNDAILNTDTLRRGLGIFNRKSSEFAAMAVALKRTGINVGDLDRLVRVVENAAEQGGVDVSTFIARRATLGGFKSVTRALVPGASFTGAGTGAAAGAAIGSGKIATATAAVGIMVGLRRLGRAITDPATMRSLIKAIDPNLALAQRDAAAARFLQLMTRRGFSETIRLATQEVLRRFGLPSEETVPSRLGLGGQR